MAHHYALLAALLVFAGSALAQDYGYDEAMTYLGDHAESMGLFPGDIADLVVSDHYTSRHNGVTHLYLQQRFAGVPVHNAILTMAFLPDGAVLTASHRFVTGLDEAVVAAEQSLDPVSAVQVAAGYLGLVTRAAVYVMETVGEQEVVVSDAGIAQEPIPVRLVYQPIENGEVRLAWMVGIYVLDGAHYWSVSVDAATGQILRSVDLVVHDHWGEAPQRSVMELGRAFEEPETLRAGAIAAPPAPARSATGGQYRVYEMPVESPTHAGDGLQDLRSLANSPADPGASPLGWHDTGSASYTITRGNNVHAYTDTSASNSPDPGSEPDGGPELVFDFSLDLAAHPSAYRDAAVTNLFYWNNIAHDVAYHYGFDEPAGNFQVNNFGLGGLGGDPVRAEAQDGGGVNNATFMTPVDGSPPRMQMFIWTSRPALVVHAPAAVAGEYAATGAAFGPPLDANGVSGTVVLAIDDAGLNTACAPITNNAPALAGNIAMIDRGDCTFVSKITHAQQAGAIGVIMVNNVGGAPITMGGTGPGVVIPSLMISLAHGNAIKDHLGAGVEATLAQENPDRDSDFDAGVIVHEYAHGISIRLTGGPSTNQCLTNAQQAGEGWSDWYGLMLTGGDVDHRGIGTYLRFQPPDGPGIRPARYSTSMSVNPYTFGHIGSVSIPHGVGFIFASMMWDMTQLLIDDHGYDPDLYNGTGGNNLALQLVTDGLKLQTCSPGFVDSRDAILAADVALTGGDNQCRIWQAFARRGLGYSASQGSPHSTTGVTQAFDMPPACEVVATGDDPTSGPARLEPVFPNPALANANVSFTLPAVSEVRVEVFDLVGRRVTTLLEGTVEAGTHEVSWSTAGVGAGVYVVRMVAGEHVQSRRITVLGSR